MFTLRYRPKSYFNIKIETNYNSAYSLLKRFLNYTSIEYEEKHDPRPFFFNKEVQSLLKILTRVDASKVFRRRKFGEKRLEEPTVKFMTNEELENARKVAFAKAEQILQIPPVVPRHTLVGRVLSNDPELQGLETSKLVFTDITYGINNSERIIVVREPNGILREAEGDERHRMNQAYFPQKFRTLKLPRMFEDRYFEDLLNRQEYEFILDNACMQLEPYDSEYQRITSITYQHVNDNGGFKSLRSTRHFGALTFFLVWHKNIDNLLLELIETSHIEEVSSLLDLFSIIHNVSLDKSAEFSNIEDYIKKFSNKKSAHELGMQAYKELLKQKQQLEEGIKTAHGLS